MEVHTMAGTTGLRAERQSIRLTSDVDNAEYPITSSTVTLMLISPEEVLVANDINGKMNLILQYQEGGEQVLLSAWPGNWRTDTFVIDEVEPIKEALMGVWLK